MRKLFALIMVLGVLACALGVYSSNTFINSDYYRVLNPICRSTVGQEITPDLVKNLLSINVSGNLPGVGKFGFSIFNLIDNGVDIPGYGKISLSGLLGTELSFSQKLWAKTVIAGYGWSHELTLYGGIATGLMLFLLIGTHRPRRRNK